MGIDVNSAIAQGYVVAVTENDNNTKVTIVVNDDYRNRDGEYVNRGYFLPITFFGSQGENAANLIEKGMVITVQYKVTSFIPQGEEYHSLSLVGDRFFLPRRTGDSEDEKPARRNNNKRKSGNTGSSNNKRRQKPQDDFEDDDWGDIPF